MELIAEDILGFEIYGLNLFLLWKILEAVGNGDFLILKNTVAEKEIRVT